MCSTYCCVNVHVPERGCSESDILYIVVSVPVPIEEISKYYCDEISKAGAVVCRLLHTVIPGNFCIRTYVFLHVRINRQVMGMLQAIRRYVLDGVIRGILLHHDAQYEYKLMLHSIDLRRSIFTLCIKLARHCYSVDAYECRIKDS